MNGGTELLGSAAAALQLGFVETLYGPVVMPPAEAALVVAAVGWAAWVDARKGIIPDLVVGGLAGLALARLAPFGAAAVAGGAAVGAAVLVALHLVWLTVDWVGRHAGMARGGVAPLGAGDVRLLAAATVLLGSNNMTIALAVASGLLALHGVRRAQSLAETLLLGTRMGPHLATGIACAAGVAAAGW